MSYTESNETGARSITYTGRGPNRTGSYIMETYTNGVYREIEMIKKYYVYTYAYM